MYIAGGFHICLACLIASVFGGLSTFAPNQIVLVGIPLTSDIAVIRYHTRYGWLGSSPFFLFLFVLS